MRAVPALAHDAARSFAVRISLFFAASFFLVGAFTPYLPVWLDAQGLSAREIAIVLAAPLFVRVVFTPTVAFLADRTGARRRVLIGLAAGTLAASLALSATATFWPILLVATLYAVFWSSVLPLTEAVAMTGVRAFGLDYGRLRLWGSASFIGASVFGGAAIGVYGAGAALWLLIGAASLLLAAALALPGPARDGSAAGAPTLAARTIQLSEALALAGRPLFLLFVASASLVQASHAVLYTFGTLHLAGLGISSAWIGWLWAIGVVAEIVLFAASGAALARLGPVGLILAGALSAVVRWPLMALDPPLWALALIQVLHGATFGAAHLGAIHFIAAAIPDRHAATAQGLYATLASGIVIGLATLAAGPLYDRLGSGAFLAMGILGAFAAALCLVLMRAWDGGRIYGRDAP